VPPNRDVASAVATHLAWFELDAAARGWREELDGCEMFGVGNRASLAFPRADADLDGALRVAHERRLVELGCWAEQDDPVLGERLLNAGFQDGWPPHWMAAATARAEPGSLDEVERVRVCAGLAAEGVPYWNPATHDGAEAFAPDRVRHLVVRRGGFVAGHALVVLDGDRAGLFDMGVAPAARRRGVGTRLTAAALDAAHRGGARVLALNATREGEVLYRRAGFRSAGWGATWWWFPGG
jgi:ribosomal protein S18 acetylase RimI-like enzyme